MQVKFTHTIPAHVQRALYPAYVALAMQVPGLSEITLRPYEARIDLTIAVAVGLESTDLNKLKAEIDALGSFEAPFCPCGCGAVIVFDNCFKVSHPEGFTLTALEIDLVRNGQKINAIKEVRQRTGLGLKDAKDLVDRWQTNNVAGYKDPNWR